MSKANRCRVNGKETHVLENTDRGLAYGDGLLDTVPVRSGKAPFLGRHVARILKDCTRLGIPAPNLQTFSSEVDAFIEDCKEDAVVKIMVTRGSGGRGYEPGSENAATIILVEYPAPIQLRQCAGTGFKVGICETRLGINPALAGIKHLNRLEQVLAARELHSRGLDEGVMLDVTDKVVEGTRTNLFAVLEGSLHTPALTTCGVAGIMRDMILEFTSEQKAPVIVRDMYLPDLVRAEELFMCNSIIGIVPVNEFDHKILATGTMTKSLQSESEKWFDQ